MRPILYANLTQRIVTSELSAAASAYTFPPLSAGDSFGLAFRFFDVLDNTTVAERHPGVRALRATIGKIDTPPVSGDFKLKIGAGGSTALNTTAVIGFDGTAASVAALLNAVPAVQALGVVSVTQANGGWILEWVGAAQTVEFSVVQNRLLPVSLVKISSQQINGRWLHEIRPVQAPLAATSNFSRQVSDAPAMVQVKAGFIDEFELVPKKYPTVLSLTIPPTFRGMFSLRYGNRKSRLFDPANDGLDAYVTELPLLFDDTVTLNNPTSGTLMITLNGVKLNGSDIAPLPVEVFAAPPGDTGFDLSLATYELAQALRGVASITVPFEVEADLVDTLEEQDDLTVVAKRVTLLSTTLTIRSELNWAGLETVPQIDWLRPPVKESYVPFTADQVITGTQSYVTAIGDGQAREILVTHGLGTRSVFLAVRENADTGALLSPSAYTADIVSDAVVRLRFVEEPTVGQYVLSVIAAGPKSAFQAHTHTLEQVAGLTDALNDFDRRIRELTPAQLVAQAQQNFSPLAEPVFLIPDIAELLPDGYTASKGAVAGQLVANGSSVMVQPGSAEAAKTQAVQAQAVQAAPKTTDKPVPAVLFTIPALNTFLPCPPPAPPAPPAASSGAAAALGTQRMPPLLAAVRGNATPVDALPGAPATNPGTLYRALGALSLPGGGGRKSRPLQANDPFVSDGRYWYPLVATGGDEYCALEFEQVLFSLPVEGIMLLNSRQLELVCSVGLALQKANVQAQHTLILELGAMQAGSGPSFGVESIQWQAPVLSQVLAVTALETAHSFGVRLTTLGVEVMLYGTWTKLGVVPPSGSFILRARLTRFDCEQAEDPRGVLHVSVPATTAAIY